MWTIRRDNTHSHELQKSFFLIFSQTVTTKRGKDPFTVSTTSTQRVDRDSRVDGSQAGSLKINGYVYG